MLQASLKIADCEIPTMTFGQCFAILKARWRAALAVLLLTVISSILVSLLLPKQYTASASVLVDFKLRYDIPS